MVNVQIERQKGKASLVKYLVGKVVHRVVLPTECIVDNQVSDDDLMMATVHGLPWEEVATVNVTPQKIANTLRQYGIWTLADLEQNINGAVSALQAVYRIDAQALLQRAKRYVKQEVK